MRAELPRRDLRPVFHQLHAAFRQEPFERGRQIELSAPAVDQQSNGDAACGRSNKRFGHGAPRNVVGEDVRFEPDFALGRVDRRDQRGKIFGAVAQEPDRVAGHEAVHRARAAIGCVSWATRASPPVPHGPTCAWRGTRSERGRR